MQLVLVSAILAACWSAVACDQFKKCYQLPTTITHDPHETIEAFGKRWQVYKSNVATETCFNLDYVGNRNNDKLQSTLTLWHRKNDYHIPHHVVLSQDGTTITATKDSGSTNVYHRLIINDISHWWCLYSCESDGIYIRHIMCGVIDEKGKVTLDAALKKRFPKLPLKIGQKLHNVYDSRCDARQSYS